MENIYAVKSDDLEIVARTATVCRYNLTDMEWSEIWQRLRQGTSPYCVLADMGIADVRC
jgi:hypothetical protein